MENHIVNVEFHGGHIEAVQRGEYVWVSVRRACEHLGIDVEGQRQKLANPERTPWSTACVIKAVAEDGKIREQFMLHLDSVPMWLATIDAGRVRPEAKELLIAYQKEAARVLRDHFFGKPQSPIDKMAKMKTSELLLLAAEQAEQREIAEAKAKSEMKGRLLAERTIYELKPFADVGKSMCDANGLYTIGEFAKAIKTNGEPWGRTRMFEFLREIKCCFRNNVRKGENEPYQYHVNSGRFVFKIQTVKNKNGQACSYGQTLITPKGIGYVISKLKSRYNGLFGVEVSKDFQNIID
jgi:phage antirepressor YoqD-like protein